MKTNIFSIFFILCLSAGNFAQENEEAKDYSTSVESLDAIINSLYAVISGEKGQERDWDHFRFLFHADAKLIPAGKTPESKYQARFLKPQDYIKTSGAWLVENGFFEVEIKREIQTFGSISHVFSTYQAYRSAGEAEPFMRGINSIQLLNDGERWWILNVYWTQETPENPIPNAYLPRN
ncbi:hypothetical protein [Paucihalobacter sp.]|uniref:hypothetical protein n=1 Tax=Paucihalobacter sp. TaxID=2850405 RepID=UPI002FDF7669